MICYNRIAYSDGEIAQLARAIGSYPIGRGFDPLSRYHMNLNRQKYLFFLYKNVTKFIVCSRILQGCKFMI